jgi:hypothetical protein
MRIEPNVIIGANLCKQGYTFAHTLNPYHEIISRAGYGYSHSTPVHYGDAVTLHHTYKRDGHNVSVWACTYQAGVWRWETSTSTSSGRSMRGDTAYGLKVHLLSKAKRYAGLRIPSLLTGYDYLTTGRLSRFCREWRRQQAQFFGGR